MLTDIEYLGKDVFIYIMSITTALAVAGLAASIIRYMAAEDPREAAEYKDQGKQVILGWIIINILGAVITTALDLVSQISY